MAVKNTKTPRAYQNKKNKNSEDVLIAAQEIKFAKVLAGNDKRSRDKVLKTLKKWFTFRVKSSYAFKEEDFMRIWKGLFYSVWMSDKPLVQEELCESISQILDLLDPESATMFFNCSLRTLGVEWYGIDQHRLDKFLMLVRRLVRGMFRALRSASWRHEPCQHLANTLSGPEGILCHATPVYARNALSLKMHLVECWMEELAKVSDGNIPGDSLAELIRPYTLILAQGNEPRLLSEIKHKVFVYLLRQSDEGLEYEEKARVWRSMGCPKGGVDALEKVESDEESENGVDRANNSDVEDDVPQRSTAMDARAGRVDVLLPQLPVPTTLILEQLRALANDKLSSVANRRRIKTCIRHFTELEQGRYPLTVPDPNLDDDDIDKQKPTQAAKRLSEFEKKMTAEADELALRGLSRKHRKRVLARHIEKMQSGEAEEDERAAEKRADGLEEAGGGGKKRKMKDGTDALTSVSASGDWAVEPADINGKTGDVNGKALKKSSKSRRQRAKRAKELNENKERIEKTEGKRKKMDKMKVYDTSKDADVKKEKYEPKNTTNVLSENGGEPSTKRDVNNIVSLSPKKNKLFNSKKMTNGIKKSDVKQKSVLKNGDSMSTPKQSKKLTEKATPVAKKTNDRTNINKDSSATKRVTIVLKNNTAQGPIDYYKSVRQSPNIPFDSKAKPVKTNLKPNSMPSPINPFFKKKTKLKF